LEARLVALKIAGNVHDWQLGWYLKNVRTRLQNHVTKIELEIILNQVYEGRPEAAAD
jgi:hypothetical protein